MSSTTPYLAEQTRRIRNTAQTRLAIWKDIIPVHRLPVIVKSPFMVALGAYLSDSRFTWQTVGASMILSGLLWAVLYPFNEATDLACEQSRPIPRATWGAFTLLLALLCALGWYFSHTLGFLLMGMVASQCLYCSPLTRLKRFWWGNVLFSGLLNPLLRLTCGTIWGTHGGTLLFYGGFLALHLGASLRARLLLRKRDKRLGYTVAPTWCHPLGIFASYSGLLGMLALIVQGELPRIFGLFLVVATLFVTYAWSGRRKSMQELRRGWILFAVLSAIALLLLCFQSG